MDYLQEAQDEHKSANDGNYNDRRDGIDYSQAAALISIAQSLAKLADAAEKRESVVNVGGFIIKFSDVAGTQEHETTDGRDMVTIRAATGVIALLEGDDATAFLTAYRAYAGLEDGLPSKLNLRIALDHWKREHSHAMDLLRDVLADIPADLTSAAIEAAREQVTPF